MTNSFDGNTSPVTESTHKTLNELRVALLHLHKMLLDIERYSYEQTHGRVSPGALLKLIIEHEQFAWLRPVSGIIVSIDELLDDEERNEKDARLLISQVRDLLVPSETGVTFARRYYNAIQNNPNVVLAHKEVSAILAGST
jgi:hypothetical protein